MMNKTLQQIHKALKSGGKFIANYTKTPRYMEITADELVANYLSKYFKNIKRIGGGKQDPVWIMNK